jgi:hypothetical protein
VELSNEIRLIVASGAAVATVFCFVNAWRAHRDERLLERLETVERALEAIRAKSAPTDDSGARQASLS